ncbi:hypothetical protein [Capybara microvirus Cap1_SP_50]|nr:hypothetical protein [Capybara microvirus Cap1_SP_50]
MEEGSCLLCCRNRTYNYIIMKRNHNHVLLVQKIGGKTMSRGGKRPGAGRPRRTDGDRYTAISVTYGVKFLIRQYMESEEIDNYNDMILFFMNHYTYLKELEHKYDMLYQEHNGSLPF